MREKWRDYVKELKKVSYMAAPMIATLVMQYMLQVVTIMMVGHLGDETLLSGVSIAASFTTATGFSFLFGMAGALETQCGQAYGAEQYQKLGIYTYTAMISLLLVCLPIAVFWMFTEKLLISIGQDPLISVVAGKYSISLIPNLFSYAILQSLIRYFQTQSLILPLLLCSFSTLAFHVPICWLLVLKIKMRSTGAALALGLSYWFNVILLGLYMMFSLSCKKTRATFSKEVVLRIPDFFRLAIPSTVMVCLEWWSYEIIILLSGLLPNPKLEASVLSICFSVTYLHYFIPYGFGATASTRISNELGGGNPKGAKMAVKVTAVIAATEFMVVSLTLFFCRSLLGYVFSNQKEIVDQIAGMGPLISLSIIVDGLQTIFSGVARGCGRQKIGAYVNLGAYYLFGIPVGAVLAFILHLRVKGLWIGLILGSFLQAFFLSLITISTNWQKQASDARERVFEGNS